MNYAQNFVFQVTVLGPKDASCPAVVVGGFCEKMYVLGALKSCIGMTHGEDTYKESTVKIVLERLCRVFFSTNMEASKACLFWKQNWTLYIAELIPNLIRDAKASVWIIIKQTMLHWLEDSKFALEADWSGGVWLERDSSMCSYTPTISKHWHIFWDIYTQNTLEKTKKLLQLAVKKLQWRIVASGF